MCSFVVKNLKILIKLYIILELYREVFHVGVVLLVRSLNGQSSLTGSIMLVLICVVYRIYVFVSSIDYLKYYPMKLVQSLSVLNDRCLRYFLLLCSFLGSLSLILSFVFFVCFHIL